ncbi:MAG: alpha/beta hydrolase [Cyanobacteriota bacterium]|nr:alpha/beta hydrolase [Cyanobacteriota bacterium]
MPVRNRQRWFAGLMGVGLLAGTPAMTLPAAAAENLVFVTGAFRRSIPVSDFEVLARTGTAPGLLGDALRIGKQDPKQVAALLNQSVTLPLTLVSRLLNTRIGEAILERLARIFYPLKVPAAGVPAMRSAMVLGIDSKTGSLSALSFLRAYPNEELEVNIPALLALMRKASSIADLARFFTESPLDGLKGDNQAGEGSATAKP